MRMAVRQKERGQADHSILLHVPFFPTLQQEEAGTKLANASGASMALAVNVSRATARDTISLNRVDVLCHSSVGVTSQRPSLSAAPALHFFSRLPLHCQVWARSELAIRQEFPLPSRGPPPRMGPARAYVRSRLRMGG